MEDGRSSGTERLRALAGRMLKRRCVRVLLLVIAFLTLYGRYLIYWDHPYWGRMVDAETGEPIAGAVVAAKYDVEWLGLAGTWSSPLAFRETVTDEDGDFWLWPVAGCKPYALIAYLDDHPTLLAFKPGYEVVRLWSPPRDSPKTSAGGYLLRVRKLKSRKERIDNLNQYWPLEQFPEKECPKIHQIERLERRKLGLD